MINDGGWRAAPWWPRVMAMVGGAVVHCDPILSSLLINSRCQRRKDVLVLSDNYLLSTISTICECYHQGLNGLNGFTLFCNPNLIVFWWWPGGGETKPHMPPALGQTMLIARSLDERERAGTSNEGFRGLLEVLQSLKRPLYWGCHLKAGRLVR